MLYRLTDFCANFYISYFHKYFQLVSQLFLQQWSATDSIKITLSLKLCEAEESCIYSLKGIEKSNHHP